MNEIEWVDSPLLSLTISCYSHHSLVCYFILSFVSVLRSNYFARDFVRKYPDTVLECVVLSRKCEHCTPFIFQGINLNSSLIQMTSIGKSPDEYPYLFK